jgi:hypothetical protein
VAEDAMSGSSVSGLGVRGVVGDIVRSVNITLST